jgi:hypothetical protein
MRKFQVLANMLFNIADTSELYALVCRDLLRLMTFPRCMSCYTVFEFTSLVVCATTVFGLHAGEGSR